jgi:hypothetical protein
MSLPSRLLGANPSIQVSTLLSGSLSTPSAKGVFVDASFDSIQTVTVGATSVASISFTSIPATYTHLQIRGTLLAAGASPRIEFNSDSGTNYSNHLLYGSGTAAAAGANVSNSGMYIGGSNTGTSATSPFGFVIDILDYKNTNKNTTIKTLSGVDINGSGEISIFSGCWYNTAVVSSISIVGNVNYAQYSSVSLYGIKGA